LALARTMRNRVSIAVGEHLSSSAKLAAKSGSWPRKSKQRVLTSDRMIFGPDHVPAGFFTGAFCAFAGAGGGVGARSIETRRPPVKR
jgi:hypothetical protein